MHLATVSSLIILLVSLFLHQDVVVHAVESNSAPSHFNPCDLQAEVDKVLGRMFQQEARDAIEELIKLCYNRAIEPLYEPVLTAHSSIVKPVIEKLKVSR